MKTVLTILTGVLIVLLVTGLTGCSAAYKALAKVSTVIVLNYPGLRFETRARLGSSGDDVIACLGDSVTFGWNMPYVDSYPARLEAQTGPSGLEVLNLGVGGDTVLDGVQRIRKDILSLDPSLVLVQYGLNDGMLVQASPRQGDVLFSDASGRYRASVDIEDYEEAYKALLASLKEHGIPAVILGISPVTDAYPAGKEASFAAKQKEVYALYRDRTRRIALETQTPIIDLWEPFLLSEDFPALMHADGLHPNRQGTQLIADLVYAFLEENGHLEGF